MKAAVVYYSLEGNTGYVAEKIAAELGAELIRLDTVKPYPTDNKKFMVGGKDAVTGAKPELKKYDLKASDYDTVIIGTPLWAWTYAPPIKTFLSDNDITGKKIAFFVSSGGGKDAKAFDKLKKLTGADNAPCLSVIDPLRKKDPADDSRIKKFAEKIKGM